MVTDAANQLNVGRPALYTLLNRNASLPLEMALRVEKAFGVSMETLYECRFVTMRIRFVNEPKTSTLIRILLIS